MHELFPEIEPFRTHSLRVSELHTLYIEECGNPKGIPVLFLHGGPGGGLSARHRRFFDPQKFHIILFDQRGSGRSTPYAELQENTTQDLIADIEKIRQMFHYKNWVVFGGSWGSTLALSYAISHPDRVRYMILRGIFLCRPDEIRWFYQHGAHWLFPDAYEDYVSVIPEQERHDLLTAFYQRLTSNDAETVRKSALAWSLWEGSALKLIPDDSTKADFNKIATALARIECHYFVHKCFFPNENWILENAQSIYHIPTVLVHGRYDVVCPVKNAWDLHAAMPDSRLRIIADAGHAADEPGILDALIDETGKAAAKFSGMTFHE